MKIKEVVPIINILSLINQNAINPEVREKILYNFLQLMPADRENTNAYEMLQETLKNKTLKPEEIEQSTAMAAYQAVRNKEINISFKKLSMSDVREVAVSMKEFPIGNYAILFPMIDEK